jgi:hypothetical protein
LTACALPSGESRNSINPMKTTRVIIKFLL